MFPEETAMAELLTLAKSASARASAAATAGKAPAASPIKLLKDQGERPNYLERSTIRRETAIPGAAGARARASGAPKADSRNPAPVSSSGGSQAGLKAKQLPRQKPTKLYDQKAASIAKSVAARDHAAAGAKKKGLSDNAKLALAFTLLACIGAALYVSIPVVTRVTKVSVLGMANTTEKEIIDALSLTPESSLANVNLRAMESSILANPKVASAKVRRAFPDKLVVELAERKAVACVLVTEEIGTKSIAIDADGVAFAYMDSIADSGRLPVLSGIRFERFAPGQRLPEYLRPLLGDIAELSKETPSPLEAFSEIKIEKISDSEAELLLFPSGKTVPIRMPARLTKASLSSALLVLDILAGRQGAENVDEIDFRTGTIVYRTKEAQAG
jgi:cell division protein FtsQ